ELIEPFRLLLKYRNEPFEDEVYNFSYLYDNNNNIKMTQSKAMICHLGLIFDMMGSNINNKSLVLMLIDQAKDLRSEFSRVCYYPAQDYFESEKQTFINVYPPG
ncbi:unnamed protein product, partial [Rotaria sp. Silwood1]